MSKNQENIDHILSNSEILFSEAFIEDKIKTIATKVAHDIQGDVPIFLNVMNGSVFFFTALLKQIDAPFTIDYVHATRYNNTTTGSRDISWLHKPNPEILKNKNVYIIDDVLDEGHTLHEIKNFILESNAKSCKIIVLAEKETGMAKPVTADYICFTTPNKYLFGFGLDIYGLYRQLPYIMSYNG